MFHETNTGKLTILYGTPRTGKTAALADRIRDDAAAGLKVCVIIPDQFTFEYEKMLCCHLGARLYNSGLVDVLSFSRLTRTIFKETHFPEGDAADPSAKAAVLKTVISSLADRTDNEEKLKYFGKSVRHPSFVNTVMTMLGELIHSRVNTEVLMSIEAQAALEGSTAIADKLHDLRLIYTEYSNRLAALGLRDSMEDTGLAADYAAERGIFEGVHFYIDEFKSFTGDQYEMIRRIFSDCAAMTVCMTTNVINNAPHSLFACVNETCRYLMEMAAEESGAGSFSDITVEAPENRQGKYRSDVLEKLSNALVRSKDIPFDDDASKDITIVKAADIYSECNYVCAEIKRLISEDKTLRYGDIAVLSRQMNEDIPTLEAHFRRYGIPFFSGKKRSAKHHPMLLALTTVLEIATAETISTDKLLTYAKTGLSPISDSECARLEEFAFRWSIDGDTWLKDFSAPDSPEDKLTEEIRSKLITPILTFKNACHKKNGVTGKAICDALHDFIVETKMETRLLHDRFSEYDNESTDALAVSAKRENERICEETDKLLSSLSAALPDIISINEFCDIFTLTAGNIRLSNPPMSLDAVNAQQSDIARLSDPRIVFVIHANDGVFPDTNSVSETFSDRERELFAKANFELSGSMKKRMAEEKVNAYKALCAPSERLYVTYGTNDIGGKRLDPSALALRIERLFPNCRHEDAESKDILFYCRTAPAAFAACVGSDKSSESSASVRAVLEKDGFYKGRFSYLDSVSSDFGPTHSIDPSLMPALIGSENLSLSQTSYESYVQCPFKYLFSFIFKISEPMKNDLSAIQWGNAVHECLRAVLERHSNDTKAFFSLSRDALEAEINESIDKYISESFHNGFSVPSDFDFFVKVMKASTLTCLIHLREEMASSEFIPAGFEIPMGDPNNNFDGSSLSAIEFDCADGHKINFVGKCDRADIWKKNDGESYLRIIDYKTGSTVHTINEEEIENGMNLQMLFYYTGLTKGTDSKFSGSKFGGALYSRVIPPDIITKRNADNSDITAEVDKAMKLTGLIVNNDEVIGAMEKLPSDDAARRFIDTSGAVSEADIEGFTAKAEEKLKEMCSSVYSGSFSASPLGIKHPDPCKYCVCKSICGNYSTIEKREWIKKKKSDTSKPAKSSKKTDDSDSKTKKSKKAKSDT